MQNQVLTQVTEALKLRELIDTAGITQPEVEIPQLAGFVGIALRHRKALTELNRARTAHARFAQTHSDDDPAHEDLQARLLRARNVLTSADEEYTAALQKLADARNLGPIL